VALDLLAAGKRSVKRAQLKNLCRAGFVRYTMAFGGSRHDWHYWSEDIQRLAADDLGKVPEFTEWTPDDWESLSPIDRGVSTRTSVTRQEAAVRLRDEAERLMAENDALKRDRNRWQDAWATLQQANDHRRAADDAHTRAMKHFNDGMRELSSVDEARLLEIHHLHQALAALQMPDGLGDLG
jgi:FtsZ-binding cell division protein ZapB